MSVKRFVAKDMRRALELVRQQMGPEAVILSSRRVKEGVEILTRAQPQSESLPQPVSPADTSVTGMDVPMGSDGAWSDQLAVESAVKQNAAFNHARPEPVAQDNTQFIPNNITPAFRGAASGKTPAELADEIEQARRKMLAARQQQSQSNQPVGQLTSLQDYRQPASATQDEMPLSSVPASQFRQQEFSYQQQESQRFEHESQRFEQESQRFEQESQRFEQESQRFEQKSQRREQELQLQAMQSELADMRLLLEEQLSRMANIPQMSSPQHSGLMRRLKHMGLTDVPAESIVKRVKNHSTMQEAWADALAVLSRQIPTVQEDRVMQGGVFAFVGPTGAGKTTTIAKLAARYVLEHGAENVALITTDTYRIAAHDQLRSLGRILNVQVKVVDDNQDLPAVLRSLKGCPLVLIDTAGFRLGDGQLKEQLQALDTSPNIQTLLVMASNSQLQMMKATIHAHQAGRIQGCVLTKLDETGSLGEAISVVLEHQLPLYYTTNGQEIPQDLEVAKGHRLVSRAVSLLKSGMSSLAVNQ